MNKIVRTLLLTIIFLALYPPFLYCTPIKIKFGIYVKQLHIDLKTNNFTADFYWWIKYPTNFDTAIASKVEIENIEFANCLDCESNLKTYLEEEKVIKETKEYYLTGRTKGTFNFTANFKNYPFDTQNLEIFIENTLLPSSKIEFLPDDSSYVRSNAPINMRGLSDDLLDETNMSIKINQSKLFSAPFVYQTDFGDPTFETHSSFSRFHFIISVSRHIFPYLTKIIIPLFIILMLAYLVFYIPAEKLDVAAALTVTSLLSAIAFQIACSDDVPNIGYIMDIDKIFYLCYFLIAFAMAQSITSFYLDNSKSTKLQKIANISEVVSRIFFPIAFIIGCIAIRYEII